MELLNRAAEAWFGWMWPMFWQVNLLIVIVWLIDLLVRRWAWPQVRYGLWLLVLLKLVIPPSWSLPVSLTERLSHPVVERFELTDDLLATRSGQGAALMDAAAAAGGTGEPTTKGQPTPPTQPGESTDLAPAARTAMAWQVWPFLAWILGMAGFAALLWRRLGSLRRWHDEQQPRLTIPPWYHELLVEIARDWRMGQLPAIVFSGEVVTPAVCGIWRPVLFLPRNYLDTLSREEARHVLMHELAHLKRGDLWLHAIAMALQIVYWFNPLLALARRQIQHVREICCDLTVAGALRERTTAYRDTLLGTARELLSQSVAPGLGLLGVFEEPFRLVSRLRWLERPSWLWQRQAMLAAFVVAAVAVPLLLPMASGGTASGAIERDLLGEAGFGVPVPAEPHAQAAGVHHDRVLYQKNMTRMDRLLLGFRVDSRPTAVSELWVGPDYVVEKAAGRTLIVCFAESTLTYIDHADETYAVTSLPLDPASFLSRNLRADLRENRTYGFVEATGRTQHIADFTCREYKVESWQECSGELCNPSEFTVLACDDVPYDMNVFQGFLDLLRQLHDRDPGYRRELREIRGLQLRLEMRRGNLLGEQRIVDNVEEIALVDPPPDLFAIPEGYERRTVLTELR
jgi:beta-lactamase regulating signal transducer with metallopeptidase domain